MKLLGMILVVALYSLPYVLMSFVGKENGKTWSVLLILPFLESMFLMIGEDGTYMWKGHIIIVLAFIIRAIARMLEKHNVIMSIGYIGFICSLAAGVAVILKILHSDIYLAVILFALIYALISYLCAYIMDRV